MNTLTDFAKSKDGLVALGTLVMIGVVSSLGGEYNPWVNFLSRVVTACVFVYILWRVGGQKFYQNLKARRSAIAQEFESLARHKTEAESSLRELEARIADLDSERAAILEESRVQAEAMRTALLAEAHADAEKIRENARRAAESEVRGALIALRSRIADEIIDSVEAELSGRLDAAGHARLIDNALKRVVLH